MTKQPSILIKEFVEERREKNKLHRDRFSIEELAWDDIDTYIMAIVDYLDFNEQQHDKTTTR